MTCPSCETQIALHDGNGPTPEWDLLTDATLAWEEGGPDILDCPNCGSSSGLALWSIHPSWAFGNLALIFWNWPMLSKEFIRQVTDHLGHRIVRIDGGI
jgi:hypothetical protein